MYTTSKTLSFPGQKMECVFGDHIHMGPPGGAPAADLINQKKLARNRREFSRIKQNKENIDILVAQIARTERWLRRVEFKTDITLAGVIVLDAMAIVLTGIMVNRM